MIILISKLILLFFVALFALIIAVSMARVFRKAGRSGWAAFVPLYNLVVLLQIAGRPAWWVLFTPVPVVNVVLGARLGVALAQRFNRGRMFGLGLFFLGPLFFPLLAFSDLRYRKATS
jgi:uncharacterized membrane protein YhaH (DUF805 family)